ncbi:saccharopine dehydrogenase NADP-binding domain-containing protein [candidate division KSB1 bacterium]|nr:saccharopine dehydrogenase NADP-binding domain-containing protein [candidate division KSB1 bacterium]
MKKVIVLGAGLVGGPMALDLAADFNVTSIDVSTDALAALMAQDNRIHTHQADLSDPSTVTTLVNQFDFVINAVPGFMGFQTLEAIIRTGKSVVDIAFFPEDPFQLDELAKQHGVTAIMDCGVAPGMSNILVAHGDRLLDKSESALIYVGGLPEIRQWPFEYKAVFSPVDVIEEYTRPARYVEHGQLVVRPALSDPEYLNFPGIGTLEAFNSDGLRSLINTLKIPNMKEKTLRYPGHIEKMAVLRETGFFSLEPIDVNGVQIRPLDVTAKLMFPIWEMKPGEHDLTVMQVRVDGQKAGRAYRYEWNLLDRFNTETGVHSMARTTGYTATVALRMIANGLFKRIGVSAPEHIAEQPDCVEFMLAGLKERGVVYIENHGIRAN